MQTCTSVITPLLHVMVTLMSSVCDKAAPSRSERSSAAAARAQRHVTNAAFPQVGTELAYWRSTLRLKVLGFFFKYLQVCLCPRVVNKPTDELNESETALFGVHQQNVITRPPPRADIFSAKIMISTVSSEHVLLMFVWVPFRHSTSPSTHTQFKEMRVELFGDFKLAVGMWA